MKKAFALSLMFAIALCVVSGCGKPSAPKTSQAAAPSPEEVKAFVSSQVPAMVSLAEFRILGIHRDGETWVVQFDGVLTPREALFLPVNLDEELGRLQWNSKKPVANTFKQQLLRPSLVPTDRVPTVGNLRARYTNEWQFEVAQWDIKERDFGQPRSRFAAEALPLGSVPAQDPVFRYIHEGRFAVLELRSGVIYKDVVLDSLNLDKLMVVHANGITQMKLDELPPGLQAFFHYDPSEVARENQASLHATTKASVTPRYPPPPSNVDYLIVQHLGSMRLTSSLESIMVTTQPPVYDEAKFNEWGYGAWKVEFKYRYYIPGPPSRGVYSPPATGRDVEGTSYAWFRDKQLVKFGEITPAKSALDYERPVGRVKR